FMKLEVPVSETGASPASPERFFEVLERIVRWPGDPIAVFADFASRLLLRPDLPTETEQRLFTRALVLAHAIQPRPIGGLPFYNPVMWITDKEGDLPDWFVVANPRLRQSAVPKPDHVVRRTVADSLARSLPGAGDLSEEACAPHVRSFVESTEGLLIIDMAAIAQLSRSEGLRLGDVEEAVRRYKLGVTEDP